MLEEIFREHLQIFLSNYSPQIFKQLVKDLSFSINKYRMKQVYNKYKYPQNNKKVLFWETGGMPGTLTIDAIIAFSLMIRGFDVHMVLCDGTYQACIRRSIRDKIPISEWPKLCRNCKSDMKKLVNVFNIPYSFIGDHISNNEINDAKKIAKIQTGENLENLLFDTINIGTIIKSSIERYLMGYEPTDSDEYIPVVQEYSHSGIICATCANNLIKSYNPSHIFMSHGIYVDWGPARRIGRSKNIPVISWGESYLQGHYFFGHNIDIMSMDFFSMSEKSWEYCKNLPLTQVQIHRIDNYLSNRYLKNLSVDLRILHKYSHNTDQLLMGYFPDNEKPIWAIFSHIFWDNASDFSPLAYKSFNEWMIDTLRTIIKIPTVNWLIKIHPAEVWWGDADRGVRFLIAQNFPQLPENIRIIPPEAKINPLEFYHSIDGGITSCGTVGMELSMLGKPVIIAGLPHYSGKGFTYDGFEPGEYRKLLENAENISCLNEERVLLAKKYAYCYFIRKQIPLSITLNKDPKTWVGYVNYKKLNTLIPKQDPIIDFICEKVFDGEDFIMDDELVKYSQTLDNTSNKIFS